MYKYPYGDSQQLNLDWIISKIKKLEAAVMDVKFDTSGTNGKIQQKYNDQYHDVVEVDYTPVQNSKRPLSSNAGYELNGAMNNKVPYTNANEIAFTNGQKIGDLPDNRFYIHTNNDNGKYYNYFFTPPDASASESKGFNVATNQDINNLSGAINAITPLDTVPTNGSTKGITSDAVYDAINAIGEVYNGETATDSIPNNVETTTKTMTLPKGVYLVNFYGSLYSPTADGIIQMAIKLNNTNQTAMRIAVDAANTIYRLPVTAIVNVTTDTGTITSAIYHTCGSTLTSDSILTALKMK